MLNTKILPKKVYNTNLQDVIKISNHDNSGHHEENFRSHEKEISEKRVTSSHSNNNIFEKQRNNYFSARNEELENKIPFMKQFPTVLKETNNSYRELSDGNNIINENGNNHNENGNNHNDNNNLIKKNVINKDDRVINNNDRVINNKEEKTQNGGFFFTKKPDSVIWNEDRNIYIIYNENIPSNRPEEERIDCFITNEDIVNAITNPEVENVIVSRYIFIITYNRIKKQFEFNFLKTPFTSNLEIMVKLQNYIYDILMAEISADDENINCLKENLMIFYYQLTLFLFKSIIPVADFYSDKDKISKIISFITFRYSSLILKNIMSIKEENEIINNKLESLLEIKNNIYSQIIDMGTINFTEQPNDAVCNYCNRKILGKDNFNNKHITNNNNLNNSLNNSLNTNIFDNNTNIFDNNTNIFDNNTNNTISDNIVNNFQKNDKNSENLSEEQNKEIFNYTQDNLFKNIDNIINDKNLKMTDISRKSSLEDNGYKSDDEHNYAEIVGENNVPLIIEDTISTKDYNNSVNNNSTNDSQKSKKSSFKFKNLIRNLGDKVNIKGSKNDKSFNPESAYNNSKIYNFVN